MLRKILVISLALFLHANVGAMDSSKVPTASASPALANVGLNSPATKTQSRPRSHSADEKRDAENKLVDPKTKPNLSQHNTRQPNTNIRNAESKKSFESTEKHRLPSTKAYFPYSPLIYLSLMQSNNQFAPTI